MLQSKPNLKHTAGKCLYSIEANYEMHTKCRPEPQVYLSPRSTYIFGTLIVS